MSPVSRGRKNKKSRGRRSEPTLASVHAEMLRSFEPLATEGDPLDVEAFTSEVVGQWWQVLGADDDPDELIGIPAVEFAGQKGTPAAQALLRAFAAVGPSIELRGEAAARAEALAARGVAEPPWAASIGRVEVGDCWELRDVYGDQASLHCEFRYGADRHVLSVLLDSDPVEWVQDTWVSDHPDELLADVRKQAAEDSDLTALERIDPAVARRRIEDGLAETDSMWQPEVPETFREFRALALARCRALPGPAPVAAFVEMPEQAREELVEEFLASAEAKDLPDAEVARSCAILIVDFGVDYDEGRPLRVSPAKVEQFVHEWLPEEDLEDEVIDGMPAVLVAWTRWAAVRSQLPAGAVEHVVEIAEECAGHLAEAYEEDDDLERYLSDVETEDPAELEAILQRRIFAVPEVSTRIGDDDYPELDPANPDERELLIAGEHPEWHDALADPSFDGELDGVNPRLHLAMHQIVANQLWDNDPPEAWLAAQRLLGERVERHEILHRLANVAIEHLHASLVAGRPADLAAYRKALNGLGRSNVRRIR